MKRILLIFIVFFFILSGLSTQAKATTITFNISDMGSGTWEYSYMVSDFTLGADYGFTVFFDYGLYDDITPISNGADWDVITWNPQLLTGNIEQAGAYDALALVDNASVSEPFVAQFSWLGIGVPGAQYFEVYDSSDWATLESGFTESATVPIPEPATIFLLGFLLSGLFIFKKKCIKLF